MDLRVGTVKKVNKTRFTVEFVRHDKTAYTHEYRLDNWKKYGEGAYHRDEAEPLTDAAKARFIAWKTRIIASRAFSGLTEKIEEAYRRNVRDARQEIVPTEDLSKASDLLEQALELLSPKQTEEESDEEQQA